MSTERSYERSVIAWAEQRGWLTRKIEYIARRGAPDRMFIRAGAVVFIELKQEGGEQSHHQEVEMLALRSHGADAYVCYSDHAAKQILAEYDCDTQT